MAWPAGDGRKSQACKDAYNARRRKRREDPEYGQRGYDRIKTRKDRRKAEEWERRYGKER